MSNKWTIINLLKFLENPSYPSVGPHLSLLGCVGLWNPNFKTFPGIIKQIFFFVSITFFFTQYIRCCIYFNTDSLRLILEYAPFHIGILKSCYFRKDYKNWKRLINYMSTVERDQLAQTNKPLHEIINTYIRKNRRVTYFFWTLAFFSNFSIFSGPYQKNQINVNGTSVYLYMFDGYTPFRKEPPGYYISMFIQTVLGYFVSASIVGWDTLVVSIMIFFAGQLKIVRLLCNQMIVAADSRQSHLNIAECHRFHTTLVEYHKLFNALISPVMFVYLVVIAVNLGVCIIQAAQVHNDLATLMSSVIYVVACLVQLLLFYWFAYDVTVESTSVSYSTFESNWTESNKTLQKEVALLGLTTGKILVFKAGPFNEMTLATFVAILKASYSFYTLLSTTT